jgi:ADP-ribose pyrophosphatase
MIKKWDTIEKKFVENYKIFDLFRIKRKNSEIKKEGNFVVLETSSWVNIIPITIDNKVILIEQYRHGIDEITLEVPGGLVEMDEEPRLAGQRECLEETGFGSDDDALLIGENYPNPAFLNNKCYSYVWFNCSKKDEQHLDGSEDINVIEVPLESIKKLIVDKKIQHSLVLDAFFFYYLKYGF